MADINERKWKLVGLPLSAFRCDLCQEVLTEPVKQVEGIGIVCDLCFLTKKNLRNPKSVPKLDTIISHLFLTCPNQGCTIKSTTREFSFHTGYCFKKTMKCLVDSCQWTGKEDYFAGHFIKDHKEKVISSCGDGNFVVQVNIKATTVLLLHNTDNGEKYIFKIVGRKKKKPAQLALFQTSGSSKGTDMANISTTYWKIFMNLKVYCLPSFHEEDCLTDLKSSHLETIELTVSIKLHKENSDAVSLKEVHNQYTLSLLQCTVCKNTMTAPIFDCNGGHSFCESCTSKMSRCSICPRTFTNRKRNFALEQMWHQLSNSGYQDRSSNQIVKKGDKFACPFARKDVAPPNSDNCDKFCDFNNLQAHLQAKHSEYAHFNPYYQFSFQHYQKEKDRISFNISKIIMLKTCVFVVNFHNNFRNQYDCCVKRILTRKLQDNRISVGIYDATGLSEISHTFLMRKDEHVVTKYFPYTEMKNYGQSRFFSIDCAVRNLTTS